MVQCTHEILQDTEHQNVLTNTTVPDDQIAADLHAAACTHAPHVPEQGGAKDGLKTSTQMDEHRVYGNAKQDEDVHSDDSDEIAAKVWKNFTPEYGGGAPQ